MQLMTQSTAPVTCAFKAAITCCSRDLLSLELDKHAWDANHLLGAFPVGELHVSDQAPISRSHQLTPWRPDCRRPAGSRRSS